MIDCIMDLETTGLEYMRHRITCIGYCFYDTHTGEKTETKVPLYGEEEKQGEKKTIEEFWNDFRNSRATRMVGYNVEQFDYPFLVYRSVYNNSRGVDLFGWDDLLDLRARVHGRKRVYSTRLPGSLDVVAESFDINHNSGLTGKECPEAWMRKDYKYITDHCRDDVEATFGVYKKLMECGFI